MCLAGFHAGFMFVLLHWKRKQAHCLRLAVTVPQLQLASPDMFSYEAWAAVELYHATSFTNDFLLFLLVYSKVYSLLNAPISEHDQLNPLNHVGWLATSPSNSVDNLRVLRNGCQYSIGTRPLFLSPHICGWWLTDQLGLLSLLSLLSETILPNPQTNWFIIIFIFLESCTPWCPYDIRINPHFQWLRHH